MVHKLLTLYWTHSQHSVSLKTPGHDTEREQWNKADTLKVLRKHHTKSGSLSISKESRDSRNPGTRREHEGLECLRTPYRSLHSWPLGTIKLCELSVRTLIDPKIRTYTLLSSLSISNSLKTSIQVAIYKKKKNKKTSKTVFFFLFAQRPWEKCHARDVAGYKIEQVL